MPRRGARQVLQFSQTIEMPQNPLPMGQEQLFEFLLTPSIPMGDAFEHLEPFSQRIGEGDAEVFAGELSVEIELRSALVDLGKGNMIQESLRLEKLEEFLYAKARLSENGPSGSPSSSSAAMYPRMASLMF